MMQKTIINGCYELLLPEHRANRPEWDVKHGGWEVMRIEHMLQTIKQTDVVFDIGTEEGDISALIAKYTKCKMVLFEPNDRVWPCIKAIWDANGLPEPLDFFGGFLSNENQASPTPLGLPISGEIISDHGFKQLYENYPDVAQIKMDDYCERTGIYPDVITMDVEGAEFEVIRGAERVLRDKKPVIFMSVHPVFMYDNYRNEGKWKDMYGERQDVVHMLRFIKELGYNYSCIEYDFHELHMRFDHI